MPRFVGAFFGVAGVKTNAPKNRGIAGWTACATLLFQHLDGFLDLAVRPWWRFFRGYILRLGFLDGWQGYYIAWSIAFATATRYAKVKEARAMRISNS